MPEKGSFIKTDLYSYEVFDILATYLSYLAWERPLPPFSYHGLKTSIPVLTYKKKKYGHLTEIGPTI